jgi:hypothetical protein
VDIAASGDLPGLVDPGPSASEMIAEAARFGGGEQRDHVPWGWLAEREPAEAAREILTAAEGMPLLLRSVAVGVARRLGEDALPAWRELTANLEGAADEDAVRARDALTPRGKIGYTYDLGACWEHEIGLEQMVARDPDQDYPVCVAYKGDSPVEYWSEDDPEEPESFNMAGVNRRLAAFGGTGD